MGNLIWNVGAFGYRLAWSSSNGNERGWVRLVGRLWFTSRRIYEREYPSTGAQTDEAR